MPDETAASRARRDANRVPTLIAVDSTDTTKVIYVFADPATNRLLVSATVGGTVNVDSELPAAAALADGTANPTTTSVGTFPHVFNGTTWDRIRGDITNGLDVDVTRVTGTVTVDSELSAAASLADATANPSTTSVGSLLLGFNGTTWDRVRTANTGRLQVDVITGGGGGTQYTEDAAAATDPVGTAVNLIRQDTPAGLVSANGDNVSQRGTNYGAAFVQVVNSSGSFVDTFGGGTQFAEDVAHTSGDTGTLALAVSNEANTARAADGDYIPLATDTEGNTRVVGNRDHDAVDAGEPVKIGGKAATAEPTAVANADRVDAYFDEQGYQFVKTSTKTVVVSGSITRPADTVAYAVNDAITDSTTAPTTFSISGCARQNGGTGTILRAELIDSSAVANARCFILDTTFTPDNDNTALTLTDAETETIVGMFLFTGGFTGTVGANRVQFGTVQGSGTAIPFKCGASSTSLFIALSVGTIFTPTSAEKLTLRLHIIQD